MLLWISVSMTSMSHMGHGNYPVVQELLEFWVYTAVWIWGNVAFCHWLQAKPCRSKCNAKEELSMSVPLRISPFPIHKSICNYQLRIIMVLACHFQLLLHWKELSYFLAMMKTSLYPCHVFGFSIHQVLSSFKVICGKNEYWCGQNIHCLVLIHYYFAHN